MHSDAIHRALQVLEQPARLADADRASENARLSGVMHCPRQAVWQRGAHEHDAGRRRGLHRQPAIAGTHEPVASRGFFIGLGSGLSWLAWAAGTPVVMISGFSHPSTEFRTPYRVINFHSCNTCFNDLTTEFD